MRPRAPASDEPTPHRTHASRPGTPRARVARRFARATPALLGARELSACLLVARALRPARAVGRSDSARRAARGAARGLRALAPIALPAAALLLALAASALDMPGGVPRTPPDRPASTLCGIDGSGGAALSSGSGILAEPCAGTRAVAPLAHAPHSKFDAPLWLGVMCALASDGCERAAARLPAAIAPLWSALTPLLGALLLVFPLMVGVYEACEYAGTDEPALSAAQWAALCARLRARSTPCASGSLVRKQVLRVSLRAGAEAGSGARGGAPWSEARFDDAWHLLRATLARVQIDGVAEWRAREGSGRAASPRGAADARGEMADTPELLAVHVDVLASLLHVDQFAPFISCRAALSHRRQCAVPDCCGLLLPVAAFPLPLFRCRFSVAAFPLPLFRCRFSVAASAAPGAADGVDGTPNPRGVASAGGALYALIISRAPALVGAACVACACSALGSWISAPAFASRALISSGEAESMKSMVAAAVALVVGGVSYCALVHADTSPDAGRALARATTWRASRAACALATVSGLAAGVACAPLAGTDAPLPAWARDVSVVCVWWYTAELALRTLAARADQRSARAARQLHDGKFQFAFGARTSGDGRSASTETAQMRADGLVVALGLADTILSMALARAPAAVRGAPNARALAGASAIAQLARALRLARPWPGSARALSASSAAAHAALAPAALLAAALACVALALPPAAQWQAAASAMADAAGDAAGETLPLTERPPLLLRAGWSWFGAAAIAGGRVVRHAEQLAKTIGVAAALPTVSVTAAAGGLLGSCAFAAAVGGAARDGQGRAGSKQGLVSDEKAYDQDEAHEEAFDGVGESAQLRFTHARASLLGSADVRRAQLLGCAQRARRIVEFVRRWAQSGVAHPAFDMVAILCTLLAAATLASGFVAGGKFETGLHARQRDLLALDAGGRVGAATVDGSGATVPDTSRNGHDSATLNVAEGCARVCALFFVAELLLRAVASGARTRRDGHGAWLRAVDALVSALFVAASVGTRAAAASGIVLAPPVAATLRAAPALIPLRLCALVSGMRATVSGVAAHAPDALHAVAAIALAHVLAAAACARAFAGRGHVCMRLSDGAIATMASALALDRAACAGAGLLWSGAPNLHWDGIGVAALQLLRAVTLDDEDETDDAALLATRAVASALLGYLPAATIVGLLVGAIEKRRQLGLPHLAVSGAQAEWVAARRALLLRSYPAAASAPPASHAHCSALASARSFGRACAVINATAIVSLAVPIVAPLAQAAASPALGATALAAALAATDVVFTLALGAELAARAAADGAGCARVRAMQAACAQSSAATRPRRLWEWSERAERLLIFPICCAQACAAAGTAGGLLAPAEGADAALRVLALASRAVRAVRFSPGAARLLAVLSTALPALLNALACSAAVLAVAVLLTQQVCGNAMLAQRPRRRA